MNKDIAIVTINLNNATGLAKTLASIRTQRCHPAECIVIDGQSSDHSLAVIMENQSLITHWVSEKDKGVYAAQNKGWRISKMPYLLFLNSGDTFFDNQSLGHLARGITGNKKIVFGNMLVKEPGGETWVKNHPDRLPPDYFEHDTLPHPGTLISRYWMKEKGGFDEDLKICSDWKFFRAVFFRNPGAFRHVSETVCCFSADGISSLPQNRYLIEQERANELARLPFRPSFKSRLLRKLTRIIKFLE
jgi:glycosyltransferase involved in cell wall biosynthesis